MIAGRCFLFRGQIMAKLWIVSRHQGAIAWLHAQGWQGTQIDHLDIDCVSEGDVVMGTLPVNLAAEVCAKKAQYIHLSLRIPFALRGVELTSEQMMYYGADLQAYDISQTKIDIQALKSYLAN